MWLLLLSLAFSWNLSNNFDWTAFSKRWYLPFENPKVGLEVSNCRNCSKLDIPVVPLVIGLEICFVPEICKSEFSNRLELLNLFGLSYLELMPFSYRLLSKFLDEIDFSGLVSGLVFDRETCATFTFEFDFLEIDTNWFVLNEDCKEDCILLVDQRLFELIFRTTWGVVFWVFARLSMRLDGVGMVVFWDCGDDWYFFGRTYFGVLLCILVNGAGCPVCVGKPPLDLIRFCVLKLVSTISCENLRPYKSCALLVLEAALFPVLVLFRFLGSFCKGFFLFLLFCWLTGLNLSEFKLFLTL